MNTESCTKSAASVSDKIAALGAISPFSPEAQKLLKEVELIYTDLDGTMLAPGGRLFANHAGASSAKLAKALIGLKEAGIKVVPITGRSRASLAEFIRLLDLDGFVGELGTIYQPCQGYTGVHRYLTGEMPYDQDCGQTPYELIEKSGQVAALIEHFAGKLEYSISAPREVTHLLRGSVPLDEAQTLLNAGMLPLVIKDNGPIHKISGESSLVDCPEPHIYHIMPKGSSKAAAVLHDLKERDLQPYKTLAIGDALPDLEMGLEAGLAVMVSNALDSEKICAAIKATDKPVVVCNKPSIEGWCECAEALMRARGH